MKKLFLLAILAAFVFVGCGPDETTTPGASDSGLTVEKKQRSTLVYYTATWCGPCGSYGSPTFKSISNSNTFNDVTMLDIHTGNSELTPFYKNTANDTFYISPILGILNNLPLPGTIPAFFLNGFYEGGSNASTTQINSTITAYNEQTPSVGVAAKAVADGNTIKITTKTQFFKALSGTYHLSALVVEKAINHRQAVGGAYVPSFDHKFIVRASARDGKMDTQNSYGAEPIASGSIAADYVVDGSYTFEHAAYPDAPSQLAKWNFNKSNTAVAILVWKDIAGGKKEVVNTIMVDVQ